MIRLAGTVVVIQDCQLESKEKHRNSHISIKTYTLDFSTLLYHGSFIFITVQMSIHGVLNHVYSVRDS